MPDEYPSWRLVRFGIPVQANAAIWEYSAVSRSWKFRPFRRLTSAERAFRQPFRHDGIAIMALRSATGQLIAYRRNPNHPSA